MKRFRWTMPHSYSDAKEAIARVKGGIECAENDFDGAYTNYDSRWNKRSFRFTYELNFNHPLVKRAIRVIRLMTRGKVVIPDCLKITGILFVGTKRVRIATMPLPIHDLLARIAFPIARFHLDRRAAEVLP